MRIIGWGKDSSRPFDAKKGWRARLIRVAKSSAKTLIRTARRASRAGRMDYELGAYARMQTTDANKIAMALLMVLLLTKALGVFTSAIYAPPTQFKPGFALPSGEEATATAAAKPAGPAEEPLPVLLAKADAAKGQADTKVCQSCHSFEKGGAAKVGPPLWGVVGRPMASIAGFAYSDGMKKMGANWTFEELNKFIIKPKADVDGTKMTFPGEPDAHKRADILAYLQTLSDNPVPFPK